MVGQALAHYTILEKLGEGGMGTVYKARDRHLDRIVALKVLPPDKVADPDRMRRFVQEAKTASALNHPNIVTIYDIDTAGGTTFIAMECVKGKRLDQLTPHHGMPPGEVLKYSVQIADALAASHAVGIVHRDLKPANIMITEQNFVKLLDFGLAKLTDPEPAGADDVTRTLRLPITEQRTIVGTAGYMAPEQAESKPVDARSDIFSFGAVLYEMLTGIRAFRGDTAVATIAAVLRDEPKPPSQIVDGLPAELERIVRRCLRKDPAQRFQHMDDLKVALQELKQESDSGLLRAVVEPPTRRRRRFAWALGLLSVAAVLAGILSLARSGSKVTEPTLVPVPLFTYAGVVGQPTFSPDGNQVAFTWNGGPRENEDIYVKLIGTTGPPLRLTTDPGRDHSPAWSPDGRYIAFLRDSANQTTSVLLVPALGGPERKVAEAAFRDSRNVPLLGPHMTWTSDGRSLVISDRNSSLKEPFALFLLSMETGERRRLTSPPAHLLGDSGPALSPDGRTLAFTRTADAGASGLYLLELADGLEPSGQPRQITFGDRAASGPAWTADGREIIFSNWFPQWGLWRIAAGSLTGRSPEPRRLASLGENVFGPAISVHARRLVYGHQLFHASIGRIPAAGTATGGQPFISSSRDDATPAFSPDGKRIAFVSTRSGNPEVWVCDSDGSNAFQLTSIGGRLVTTPRWSPDAERIAFDSNAAGEFDIYVIAANGGNLKRMTTHPANDGNPSWSRDGKWIYFDSNRSGEQQVWRVPSNGGEPVQVTHDGAWAPIESPDGRSLYYTKAPAETSLWRMPIEGRAPTKVVDGLSSYIGVAILQSGVYFVPAQKPTSIRFLNFGTNQISLVADLGRLIDSPAASGAGLAVSPDGRWILYTQFAQASSELMLVEDFR